jgi:hypothetical protein
MIFQATILNARASTLTAPSDPQSVSASQTDTNECTVDWDAGAGGGAVNEWRVERNLNSGGYTSPFSPLPAATTVLVDDTVGPGDEIVYRVRAENAAGNSNYVESNTVNMV